MARPWMVGGREMANTKFFLQCKDCENCSETSFGHFCDKHIHGIDNPNVDGCTWGNEKEDDNAQDNSFSHL